MGGGGIFGSWEGVFLGRRFGLLGLLLTCSRAWWRFLRVLGGQFVRHSLRLGRLLGSGLRWGSFVGFHLPICRFLLLGFLGGLLC